MGSEQNDSASFPRSEPKLCANGCGFFGVPSNMNLCSKCYRDLRAKEDHKAVAKASFKSSSSTSLLSPPQQPAKPDPASGEAAIVFVDTEPTPMAAAALSEPSRPPPNRCSSCNKKVRVMGFKCKCGSTFCGEHRYPEKHECSFNYREAGRDAIAKANPLVKADKVQRL